MLSTRGLALSTPALMLSTRKLALSTREVVATVESCFDCAAAAPNGSTTSAIAQMPQFFNLIDRQALRRCGLKSTPGRRARRTRADPADSGARAVAAR